jgi:hypothetical protein
MQAAILAALLVLSLVGAVRYYFFFEKEEWAKAAGYIAGSVQPDDLILFNASWVQIPFEYYFRDYQSSAALHGLPVDLFDRGELEPQMTEADIATIAAAVNGRRRVWLVYSHDWYTDPQQIIPRELNRLMRRTDQQDFRDLRIMRFETR